MLYSETSGPWYERQEARQRREEREHFKQVCSERDRYRDALRQADEELLLIADEAPEDIGERIDSVRALLKDAAITPAAPFDEQDSASAARIAPRESGS